MKNLDILLLFDYYGDYLNDKQRELFDYYYNDDLSLAEVAENAGISRQGVRDSVKRTEQQLLLLESKLHFCEKSEKLKRLAADAADDNEKLQELFDYINEF